jgi:hypothetical protein
VRGFYRNKFKKVHQRPKYLNTDNLEAETLKRIAIMATNQKVTCSIPTVSLEIFIQEILPVTLWPGVDICSSWNEQQEYVLRGKRGRCLRLKIMPPSRASVLKCGSLNHLETKGTVQTCAGIASFLKCVPNCLISFNSSLEPSPSLRYKADSIVVNLPEFSLNDIRFAVLRQ